MKTRPRTQEHTAQDMPEVPREKPERECDVVMKGGVTSGVVYPQALVEIGAGYRFRALGGASAGAIGAALGAAAEFGRSNGGFERLFQVPDQAIAQELITLFQPEKTTRPLMAVIRKAVSDPHPNFVSLMMTPFWALRGSTVLGALPGLAVAAYGGSLAGLPKVILILAGLIILVIGSISAVLIRLSRLLTRSVPENLFGICRGHSQDPATPGLTDWLSKEIDEVAGLSPDARPLRFGQLWSGAEAVPGSHAQRSAQGSALNRDVDLRLVTTCLSEGKPYEMPWAARNFYFEEEAWRTLFPPYVMDALASAPSESSPGTLEETAEWEWYDRLAQNNVPRLRRLPDPEDLPVIVATRLSLSFPLLISAVPLWKINFTEPSTRDARRAFKNAVKSNGTVPADGVVFSRLWFTDGGFSSNFPMAMFDSALPTRPTFAINLGRFPADKNESADESLNIKFAKSNNIDDDLLPYLVDIPATGLQALSHFAFAAFRTSRDWHDNSYLDFPGHRDRVVRVLQTRHQGGLNLAMAAETIDRLAARGREAGRAMVGQFSQPHYPDNSGVLTASGWDNHRWVRYRALMSCLPDWLASYARGRRVLDIEFSDPPSYPFHTDAAAQGLAVALDAAVQAACAVVEEADREAVARLASRPRPPGVIRRSPPM